MKEPSDPLYYLQDDMNSSLKASLNWRDMPQPSLKPSFFYLEEELKRHATTIPATLLFWLRGGIEKTCHNHPWTPPFFYLEEELQRHATTIPESLLFN